MSMEKNLSPEAVLEILARRMEKRAAVLTAVRQQGLDGTIHELRHFANMMKNARQFLVNERQRKGSL